MVCFDVANITEIEKITALVNSAYRGRGSEVGWTSEVELVDGARVSPGQLLETISMPGSVILVMRNKVSIVGCVHVQCKGDNAYLGMLAIEPKLQGNGHGSHLLEYAEEYCRLVFYAKTIEMCVISQRTELLNYYLRRGYVSHGDEDNYPCGLNVGTPKISDLTIQELSKQL